MIGQDKYHYFGYMDEEDGQVMPLEAEAERRAREEALDNYTMDRELDAIEMGANVDDWDQGKDYGFSEIIL